MKIIIFSIFLITCYTQHDNSVGKNQIINTKSKVLLELKTNNIQESLFLHPLDSAIESLIKDKLVNKKVENDSIYQYVDLLNVFKNDGLKSLVFNYPKSKSTYFKSSPIPGKRVELIYQTDSLAKNAFIHFTDDLKQQNLKGKIAIKSGGICFLNGHIIHLVPISTCDSKNSINMLSSIIKKRIIKTQKVTAIKFYCALKNMEIIN